MQSSAFERLGTSVIRSIDNPLRNSLHTKSPGQGVASLAGAVVDEVTGSYPWKDQDRSRGRLQVQAWA